MRHSDFSLRLLTLVTMPRLQYAFSVLRRVPSRASLARSSSSVSFALSCSTHVMHNKTAKEMILGLTGLTIGFALILPNIGVFRALGLMESEQRR